jgi:uncharacterized protein YcbX
MLSGITIYPIKSLGGISLHTASLCPTGLLHDRRWMLIDKNNRFISQREHHHMCLFDVAMTEEGFRIRYNEDELQIPFSLNTGERTQVTIWDDTADALVATDRISNWFSERLQQSVRLVYMPDDSKRHIPEKYRITSDDTVSFADGYPILVIGEASLAALQSMVEIPVSMSRFRPNLVFTGGAPHDEDSWRSFSIKGQPFHGVKPCARCVMITIDPQTGNTGPEPLKTLATYRRDGSKVLFGQNVIPPSSGTVSVGDEIIVAES